MRLSLILFFSFFMTYQASAAEPQRIVSIAGANTEILYALGFDEQIVGTDTTSVFPQAATLTPKVGYMRALSAEGVLSLKPSLIVMTNEAGPPPVIAQLKQVGVDILTLKAGRSVADIKANIREIAKKLDVTEKGEQLIAKMDADLALLNTAIAKDGKETRLMFIMQHGGGAPMVAGTKTAADSIMNIAGAKNVVADYSGYKPLTPEAAVKMNPDYILVTNMGLAQAGGMKAFANIPGVNLTEAAQNGRIIAMDALYLLGFGPRTPAAALKLRQKMTGLSS